MTDQPLKTSPKDFFLHLLTIVTLYASAVGFGTILFQLINVYVEDTLTPQFSEPLDIYYRTLRYALSAVIIMFPTQILTMWYLHKQYQKQPEKKQARIRKWLIYFTLFAAAVINLIALISLVNHLLNGELTIKFFLKMISIFFVAGSILRYYSWNIKTESLLIAPSLFTKYFVWGIVMIVLSFVIVGALVVGTPNFAREQQFDQQRVNDLSSLQWAVAKYWQAKTVLPERLDEIKTDFQMPTLPVDPKTNAPYEYEKRSNLTFALCATFETVTQAVESFRSKTIEPFANGGFLPEENNWQHGLGRTCFERTIDPDFFKPQ